MDSGSIDVEYVLDVPMYFVYRDGVYHDVTGESFRDFMRAPQFPGEYPTLDDWEQHLTTCFPEVRLKRYMEMRGADGGRGTSARSRVWWVLYDEQALADAALVADWTSEEREFPAARSRRRDCRRPSGTGRCRTSSKWCESGRGTDAEARTRRTSSTSSWRWLSRGDRARTRSRRLRQQVGMDIDRIYKQLSF